MYCGLHWVSVKGRTIGEILGIGQVSGVWPETWVNRKWIKWGKKKHSSWRRLSVKCGEKMGVGCFAKYQPPKKISRIFSFIYLYLYLHLSLQIQRSGKCFCGQQTLKCFKIFPKQCWSSLPIGKYLFDGGAILGEKIDFALLEGDRWSWGVLGTIRFLSVHITHLAGLE